MLGGLLLRLPFWMASSATLGWPLVLDEGNYVGLAEPLSRGEGIVDKWAWMRPPGYPAFIAFFLILGLDLSAAALAQILLSVANIGMVYALAVEVFHFHSRVSRGKSEAAGLLAASLLAINPHAAYYADLLMPETPYMLALTIMAWALLRVVRLWQPAGRVSRSALVMLALAALMASAAIYMRSALQTFVPLVLGWLMWVLPAAGNGRSTRDDMKSGSRLTSTIRRKLTGRTLLAPFLFLGVMFAVIAPWTLRNYLTYDRFMVMDAVGGLNLWQYNGDLSRAEVLARLGEIPNPVDRDRYATEQGVQAILSHPVRFAGDAVERFTAAWPVEYYSELWVGLRNKYPGIDCTYLDLFSWASTFFYLGLGLLVIWGFTLAPGRIFNGLFLLFLLHYVLTTIFAHNEFRYRLPLYPYASVFAGWALLRVVELARSLLFRRHKVEGVEGLQQRISRVGLLTAAILSLIFVTQSVLISSPGLAKSLSFERRFLEGKAQMERGDHAGALASFLGAEEIDRGCACLYRNIGLAHGSLGQRDEERAAYMTALEREEYDWRTSALLSDRLRLAGSPRAPDPIRATRPEYRTAQQKWAWENLQPPPTSNLDLGGADIGYVLDWHSAETEGEISYRWSKGRSAVRLQVPRGEGILRLNLHMHSLAWPGKADPEAEVRVRAEGQLVGTVSAGPGWEWDLLEVGGLEGDRQVVIQLEAVTSRPPGGETRSLGIAVDRIRLERTAP
jgi:hypothetical protein